MTITTKLLQKHQNPLESASSLYRNQRSWLKSLNVTDISKQYSTPLYITNWTQLLDNLKIFSALLKGAENVYFPVKPSPSLATIRKLYRQ